MKLSEGSSAYCDLVRSVSAQVVVVGHGIAFFGIFKFLHEPRFPWMQNIAVILFFILSGFIITYTISSRIKTANDKQIPYGFGDFFIDRFSRIFSAFFPALLFVLCIDSLSIFMAPEKYTYFNAFNLKTFVANLFMLQDFPGFKVLDWDCCTSFGSARPFWSLAIEWYMYMFFGFLLLVFNKKPSLFHCGVLVLLGMIPFCNIIKPTGLTVVWLYGALAWLILAEKKLDSVSHQMKLFVSIMIFLAAVARVRLAHMNAYDPIFAFLLAILFLLGVDYCANIQFRPFIQRFIKVSASYSFTLYLVHYSVLDFIYTHLGSYNPYLLFIAGYMVSNAIAFMIGSWSETGLKVTLRKMLQRIRLRGTGDYIRA